MDFLDSIGSRMCRDRKKAEFSREVPVRSRENASPYVRLPETWRLFPAKGVKKQPEAL